MIMILPTGARRRTGSALFALTFGQLAFAQAAPSPILKTMSDELARNYTALKSQPTPPYFLSYEITDTRSANVTSNFGALEGSNESHRRQLDITLRVGSYAFDNAHVVRGDFGRLDGGMDRFGGNSVIPVDDDPAAIKKILWYQTDRRYNTAVQALSSARTNARVAI